MAYVKPVPGKIFIEVRSIPNYEIAGTRLKQRMKATDPDYQPSAEDIDSFIKEECTDMEFLPLVYQKPVCMCLIHDKLPGDKRAAKALPDSPESKWTMECMVGSEPSMIRRFWNVFMALKQKCDAYPLLISSDRKKGSIPLIINRSFAIARENLLAKAAKGVLPAPPTPDEKPGPYASLYAGMKEILDKSDKWEKYRPNYTYPYSIYTPDIASDISSVATADKYTVKRSEQLVREGDYQLLARETAASAMDSWKNYAVMRYLSEGDEMILDCTPEKGFLSSNIAFTEIPFQINPITMQPTNPPEIER